MRRRRVLTRALTDRWTLGGHELPNRLVLAPLAGIGNWFVRLQARRHGAGLVVSEMVSSFGIKHGNERTVREFLRIHPDEHPVSMQLFGHDADVMREAAEIVAGAGADIIDLNMGCPVRKVCKTGAGAALLDDPDKAVAIAKAAGEGSGPAGHREAAPRPAPRGPRWGRARAPPGGGGRRGRDQLSPPPCLPAAQGQARLRARGGGGRRARRAGDRVRRAARRRQAGRGARAQRRGGGDARPRLAWEPMAVRAPARPARRRADARTRWWRSCAG